MEIDEKKKLAAMDIIAEMAVSILAEQLNKEKDKMLIEFMQSNTCKILYDDKCKLWWDSPAAVAEEFKAELAASKSA